MQEIEINNSNYRQVILDIITNKKESLLYGICGGKVVLTGENDINFQYANDNGYEVWLSPTSGGSIVVNQDDVEIDIFRDNGWDDGDKFVNLIVEYLASLSLNVIRDNNDILVDGFKVGSYSSKNVGDSNNPFIFTGIHLSFSVNLEDIRQICKKEMIKIPKGLLEFGVNQQDLINYVLTNKGVLND